MRAFYLNERRIAGVYIIIMIMAGFVFFKLYTISSSDYSDVMPVLTSQYTRKLNVAERRGFIFDRNGDRIAGLDDAFNCVVDPSKMSGGISNTDFIDFEKAASIIADACELDYVDSDYILDRLVQGRPFIIRVNQNLNADYMKSYRTFKRNNGVNFPALHIIGYLDSDGVGVTGIEAAHHDFLVQTGSKIDALYDSDALNKSLKTSPIRTVDYGYNTKTGIMLTLDLELQNKVEAIADKYFNQNSQNNKNNKNNKGAIIIASASTGEILASVSRPVFSPNHLADYIDSPNGEFINRAFSSFTPGSIFKTIVAAAALEDNPDYFNYNYDCVGYIHTGSRTFYCRGGWGHRDLNMCEAYAHSCNTYFMDLALQIGYDKIRDMAKLFGIGEKNMLDGLFTQSGNIPDVINPTPAFIANTAIGQGEWLITPLEAVRIFCAIANNGVLPELSLIKSFVFENQTSNVPNTASQKILSDTTVDYLLQMTQACVSHGTGELAAPQHGVAGGKTSSAESGQYADIPGDDGVIRKTQIVHSWFSGYYPADVSDIGDVGEIADISHEKYAISIIAEGGVTENIKSAAIFKEICDFLYAFGN